MSYFVTASNIKLYVKYDGPKGSILAGNFSVW